MFDERGNQTVETITYRDPETGEVLAVLPADHPNPTGVLQKAREAARQQAYRQWGVQPTRNR